MYRLLVPVVLSVLVSCGPGQPTFLDHVRPLKGDHAHPLLLQLLPLLQHPEQHPADSLMRTWNEFLGDAERPLRQENRVTFVYYDFTKALDQVYLEASFAPGKLLPLTRWGQTSLYYDVYEVPKLDRLKYRFSDGKTPLVDPFHPDVIPGDELWQQAVPGPDLGLSVQKVLGASQVLLAGQDVSLALPPLYHRNLAWTYPLLVVVGLDGPNWTRPLAQLLEQSAIRPVVAVAVGSRLGTPWTGSELKATVEEKVVPWVRSHYRVSSLPADLFLVGWGDSARAVREMAGSRPDFWPKSWIVPPTEAQGEEAWNSQAQAWLRTQFPVVTP